MSKHGPRSNSDVHPSLFKCNSYLTNNFQIQFIVWLLDPDPSVFPRHYYCLQMTLLVILIDVNYLIPKKLLLTTNNIKTTACMRTFFSQH